MRRFAAQVLAAVKAFSDAQYCKEEMGIDEPFDPIPRDRLNIDGGAISIGHPVGASGARIVLRLANILKEKEARYAIASLCIGGGQGGAMLLERCGGKPMIDKDYKHWRLDTCDDNILWLAIDKAESSVNVLSSEVLNELSEIIGAIASEKPDRACHPFRKKGGLYRRRRCA